jgi:hypothetical protein
MALFLAVVLCQDAELVERFLGGSKEAGEALRKRGREALPEVAKARLRCAGHARQNELLDLEQELRASGAAEPVGTILKKLDSTRTPITLQDVLLADLVAYLREFTGINIVIDPTVENGTRMTVEENDASIRRILDRALIGAGLDFDIRFDAILISRPDRLWKIGEGTPIPAASAWKVRGARDKTATYLRETKIDFNFEECSVRDILAFVCDFTDLRILLDRDSDPKILNSKATIAIRDLTLSESLDLLALTRGLDLEIHEGVLILYQPARPPRRLRWSSQELKGQDAKLAEAIRGRCLSVDIEAKPLRDAVAFLREELNLSFVVGEGIGALPVSVRGKDLPLPVILEAICPGDVDARIESGAMVFFDARKKRK